MQTIAGFVAPRKRSVSRPSYTDVRNRRGDGLGQPPFIPGVEVAGTVRAVGAGVTSLRPGQPVAAFTRGHGYAEVATAAEAFTIPVTEDLAGAPGVGGDADHRSAC